MSMPRPSASGRPSPRLAGLGLAGLMAAAGLWLAVGAGATEERSARDAAYPTTFAYAMKFTSKPAKSTKSHKAKFRFKPVFSSNGQDVPPGYETYLGFECKLDKKAEKSCSSPAKYKVGEGKHKLSVKAVFKSGADASESSVAKWKVTP